MLTVFSIKGENREEEGLATARLATAWYVMLPHTSQELTTDHRNVCSETSLLGAVVVLRISLEKVAFSYPAKRTIMIISHEDKRCFDLLLKIKLFDINTLKRDNRQILRRFSFL